MSTIILTVLVLLFIISSIVFSIMMNKYRNQKNECEEGIRKIEETGEYSYRYNTKAEYQRRIEKVKEQEETLKFVKKITAFVFLGAFAITTIFSSIYFTGEQNLAVITTFGKAETVSGTGIHFKIPYIQKVEKLDSTIQGFAIGYQEDTNETQIVDSMMITSDFNFVNVDFYVEYRINDPILYLYGSSNPEGTLKNIAQASIRNTIGRYSVDSVLTTGKSEIQAVIKEDIVKELETTKTGLTLINITIQDAEPPTEAVSQAFKGVETAKQEADSLLNQAEQYKNEQIPKAEADADAIMKEAEATKQERVDEATGEVALFNAMYEEYKKDPDVSKVRIYYETMEELMPNLKIIVNGTDSEIKPIIVQEGDKEK